MVSVARSTIGNKRTIKKNEALEALKAGTKTFLALKALEEKEKKKKTPIKNKSTILKNRRKRK